MDYSRTKGECIYPIRPGVVVKLARPDMKYNKRLKARCEHDVIFWIYRISQVDPRDREQCRKVFVKQVWIPRLEGMKNKLIVISRPIQFKTLSKYMAGGYRILREGLEYRDTHKVWVKFYRTIGVLDVTEQSASTILGGQSNGLINSTV